MRVLRAIGVVVVMLGSAAEADDWPQWLGPRRDGVWREGGIVEVFPKDGPVIRWRRALGAGYSGPVVAEGRVYVTDRVLRGGTSNPGDPFSRGKVPGVERVVCLDESDGRVIWQDEYACEYTISYPAGPRASPLVAGGRLYTVGAEGHVRCYEAVSGKVIWQTRLGADSSLTPAWGYSGSPLIEGNKLICLGNKKSVAIALDKETGQVLWRSLSARDAGYAPPTVIEAGGRRQLIIWHPQALVSLDPETGRTYWSEPFEVRTDVSVATPRQEGDLLYITCFYNGSLMMKLDRAAPRAARLWRRAGRNEYNTEGLHGLMCTPFIKDGHIYGVCAYGQLRCIKLDGGDRVWETLAATTKDGRPQRWANVFIVANGDRFFLANELGDLIIARLSPAGYQEISRAHLIEPTNRDAGRPVVWSHPAFANKSVYMRNDKEIICVSLAAP